MVRVSKDYKEFLNERLQDPEEASLYLEAMYEGGDDVLINMALADIKEANNYKLTKDKGMFKLCDFF
jgi:DNA-binding phage protein